MSRTKTLTLILGLIVGGLVLAASTHSQEASSPDEAAAVQPGAALDETFPAPVGAPAVQPEPMGPRQRFGQRMQGQRREFGQAQPPGVGQGQPGAFGQNQPHGPGMVPGMPPGGGMQGPGGLRQGQRGRQMVLAWDQIRRALAVIARVEPDQAQELRRLREYAPEEFRTKLQELTEGIFEKYEDKVLEHVEQCEPEAGKSLKVLKGADAQRYRLEVLARIDRVLDMEEIKEKDPEHYELLVQERNLTRRSFELARVCNKSDDSGKKDEAQAELAETLGELFDVRMKLKEKDVERIEKDIARLKEQIAARRENRNKIIELRLLEMTRREEIAW